MSDYGGRRIERAVCRTFGPVDLFVNIQSQRVWLDIFVHITRATGALVFSRTLEYSRGGTR